MFCQEDCLYVILSFCGVKELKTCHKIDPFRKILNSEASKKIAINSFNDTYEHLHLTTQIMKKPCKNSIGSFT